MDFGEIVCYSIFLANIILFDSELFYFSLFQLMMQFHAVVLILENIHNRTILSNVLLKQADSEN